MYVYDFESTVAEERSCRKTGNTHEAQVNAGPKSVIRPFTASVKLLFNLSNLKYRFLSFPMKRSCFRSSLHEEVH